MVEEEEDSDDVAEEDERRRKTVTMWLRRMRGEKRSGSSALRRTK